MNGSNTDSINLYNNASHDNSDKLNSITYSSNTTHYDNELLLQSNRTNRTLLHSPDDKSIGDKTLEGLDNSRLDFYIGLTLACVACLFIGASFIFKKKGLLNLIHRAGKCKIRHS